MYYKGEKFNRAEELLIQAGSKLAAGETLPLRMARKRWRAALSLCKGRGRQCFVRIEFFICRDSTILDSEYTIFGNVISGMDVVDNIAVDDVITNITIRNKE